MGKVEYIIVYCGDDASKNRVGIWLYIACLWGFASFNEPLFIQSSNHGLRMVGEAQ